MKPMSTMPSDMAPAMDTSELTINVPEDQQDEVQSWEDGKSYELTVTQTAPGKFDLVSSEPAESADEETNEGQTADDVGSSSDTAGTTIPTKNPAVANLIMSKRGK